MTIIVEIGCRRSDTLCELSQLETCKMLTFSAHCSIVFVVLVNVGFVHGAFRDVDGAVPYGKCGFCHGWRCFRGSAEPAGAKRKRAYHKIGSRRMIENVIDCFLYYSINLYSFITLLLTKYSISYFFPDSKFPTTRARVGAYTCKLPFSVLK